MNCLKKFALSALTVALIVGFSVSIQAKEWKGWNIHVAGYPNTVAMDKFAELLKEKSGGKMTLKMYHAGTLGSQPDAIEQVRLGGLEIGNFNLGPLGPIVPEANVVSLPFIFKNLNFFKLRFFLRLSLPFLLHNKIAFFCIMLVFTTPKRIVFVSNLK